MLKHEGHRATTVETPDQLAAILASGRFDVVIDRGCFHVIKPSDRPTYVRNVRAWLTDGGRLCLKCFSHKQSGDRGPHRFSPEDIRRLFEPSFRVESIEETTYQGNLQPPPRALFCTLSSRPA